MKKGTKQEPKNKGKQVSKGTELLKEEVLKEIGKEIEDLFVEVSKVLVGKQTKDLEYLAEMVGKRCGQIDEELGKIQDRIQAIGVYTFTNSVFLAEENNPGHLGKEGRRKLANDLGIDLDGIIEELRQHPPDPDYLHYLQGKLATLAAPHPKPPDPRR